eukprot:357000-Chlamydomonas_euryale.AAC.6
MMWRQQLRGAPPHAASRALLRDARRATASSLTKPSWRHRPRQCRECCGSRVRLTAWWASHRQARTWGFAWGAGAILTVRRKIGFAFMQVGGWVLWS